MNIFEKASRIKLRFVTAIGSLSAEDLWDLPLSANRGTHVSLDDMARHYYKEANADTVPSFVVPATKETNLNQLKFDIVKHIIDYKLEMQERSRKAAATRARNQRILEIIADKEDETLKGKSLEELKKLVEEGDEE